jgi:hypothetical protein
MPPSLFVLNTKFTPGGETEEQIKSSITINRTRPDFKNPVLGAKSLKIFNFLKLLLYLIRIKISRMTVKNMIACLY